MSIIVTKYSVGDTVYAAVKSELLPVQFEVDEITVILANGKQALINYRLAGVKPGYHSCYENQLMGAEEAQSAFSEIMQARWTELFHPPMPQINE